MRRRSTAWPEVTLEQAERSIREKLRARMKLATRSPEQKQEEMRAILVEKKAERTAKQVLMDSVMRKYSPNEAAMERAYAANHATRSVRSRKF